MKHIKENIRKQVSHFSLFSILKKTERKITAYVKEYESQIESLLKKGEILELETIDLYYNREYRDDKVKRYINSNSLFIKKGTVLSISKSNITIDINGLEIIIKSNNNILMPGDKVLYYTNSSYLLLKPIERINQSVVARVGLSRDDKVSLTIVDKQSQYKIKVSKNNIKEIEYGTLIKIKIPLSKAAVVEKIYGPTGDFKAEIVSHLNANGFLEKFTTECLKESEKQCDKKVVKDKKQNLVDLYTVTIDGDDSKDFDDAVSIIKKSDRYILYVHIADVAEFVKMDSLVDLQAREKTTSIYLPQNVYPMLPELISNYRCSLMPNVERYTITAEMHIDKKSGKMIDTKVYESYIESDERLTYKGVDSVLKNENKLEYSSKVKKLIFIMRELNEILQKKREKEGYIEFFSSENKYVFDQEGELIDILTERNLESAQFIENFMVCANECVSRFMTNAHLPCIYRIHDKPDNEKLAIASNFASTQGLRVNLNKFSSSYPKELKKIKDERLLEVISQQFLRAMAKAQYSEQNIGHYGLGLKYYSHFTSPIRRYSDLALHRVLKKYLSNGKKDFSKKDLDMYSLYVKDSATQCTKMERNAIKLQRDIEDLYKCKYMAKNKDKNVLCTVCSITNFGMFVSTQNGIDALVRFDNLPKDYYLVEQYSLKGKKNEFKIGDIALFKVLEVDIETRKISMKFIKKIKEAKYGKKASKKNNSR